MKAIPGQRNSAKISEIFEIQNFPVKKKIFLIFFFFSSLEHELTTLCWVISFLMHLAFEIEIAAHACT